MSLSEKGAESRERETQQSENSQQIQFKVTKVFFFR